MKSELARWPRRLTVVVAVAWVFFLLVSSASDSWDGLALAGVVTMFLAAATFIGLVAGIGFLAAGLMEHDLTAIVWSAVLLVITSIPVIVTLVLRA